MSETKTCPSCGGTSGYRGWMTETHKVVSNWGQSPEATDSGYKVKLSLMECIDCGKKFNIKTCER